MVGYAQLPDGSPLPYAELPGTKLADTDPQLPDTTSLPHSPLPAAEAPPLERHEIHARLSTRPTANKHELAGGGRNAAHILHLDDGQTAGIFKPVSGEERGMRSTIPRHESYHKREVAAARVAEALGMHDMVPPTVFRTENGEEGSFQHYVHDAHTAVMTDHPPFDGDENAVRAAVFDYLIGNTDRHPGNWLVRKSDGHPILIDHGLSFPETHTQQSMALLGGTVWRGNNDMIEHAIENRFTVPEFPDPAGTWFAIEEAMRDSRMSEDAIERTRRRMMALMQHGGKEFGHLPWMLDEEHSTQPGRPMAQVFYPEGLPPGRRSAPPPARAAPPPGSSVVPLQPPVGSSPIRLD